MACTIVSTPATGAADWTGWITQQGLTDRGFMQVSLTNFATTAASLIGTGSVFELAGSIYSCTETSISLAAGTISAAVSVYYVAIPSAGGTTCTFTMDSVAPTWVDAKQGYYASAASTSRYLGGTYLVTTTSFRDKWLYQNRYSEKPRLRNTGIKIGNSTRDSSGAQVITGVGFKPSIVMFFATNALAGFDDYSYGFDDGTIHMNLAMGFDGLDSNVFTSESIRIIHATATSIVGSITALSDDGFTITWTEVGVITMEFIYICLP